MSALLFKGPQTRRRTDEHRPRFEDPVPPTPDAHDRSDDQGTLSRLQSPPTVSLPKGGGAIRGIDEKPAANPVTGSSSMAVPIATSPGRSGFGPELSLTYDSGTGNGPWGFGWDLNLPSVTRKTAKGLPQYRDADESDVFILSGAEDLVPVLDATGHRHVDTESSPDFRIHRYRPRVEGLFARIERWTRVDEEADVHWRVVSRDNLLSVYGRDAESRIFDPEDPSRIFQWLLCETRDDRGQGILYGYKAEDGIGLDLSQSHERHRGEHDDPRRSSRRYLKRIHYGNRSPLLDGDGRRPHDLTPEQRTQSDWLFEVVFDYGEHDLTAPTPDDGGAWEARPDPFSTYRPGFEVRTHRLCRRVLMFHHFENEAGVGRNCLVRSTDFDYSQPEGSAPQDDGIYTFLNRVQHASYTRQGQAYRARSLPALELGYSRPSIQDRVEEPDPTLLDNLPMGIDGAAYQWVDLHGEGIPGVLSEHGETWLYKRNLSSADDEGLRLGSSRTIDPKPNRRLADGARFMDLAGDGRMDVAVLDGPQQGFFETARDSVGWQGFQPFQSGLPRETGDPNLKLVDLTGDGRADVLITEDDAFLWYPSMAEQGFGEAERVSAALHEDEGPRLVFADSSDSIFLADLSGDGLTDLARIRNGEVCYWPNLGYGRFGAKVSMDGSPWLDTPDGFDPARIRLTDIDGSGTTDIVYLHGSGVRLYFNRSGNSWSEARHLDIFPAVDELSSVVATDLLGNGTSCLVWFSPLPGENGRSLRYVDLMGGQKPHLLIRTDNNLGAETRLTYRSSTHFYLQDELEGRPWITRLPFPVQVVERIDTLDHITGNRFVTRYAYHHGFFDGVERELRGFAMVEQWDADRLHSREPAPGSEPLPDAPPVLTKTWYHTGAYLDREHPEDPFAGLSRALASEYYREPDSTAAQFEDLLLPDTSLPNGLTPDEERQACRSLKGQMLRQEIYALDGSAREPHPYTVTEQSSGVRRLQAQGDGRHAVFLTHGRESLTFHYERSPQDPRVQHGLTLEIDDFGNVLKQATIAYGRRAPDASLPTAADRDRQLQARLTYTESRFTNGVDGARTHRLPLPAESRTYELTGYTPTGPAGRFRPEDFVGLKADPDGGLVLAHLFDSEIPYEDEPTGGRQRRLVEHALTRYRPDDLGLSTGNADALLEVGDLESLALGGESYQLAFTPGLLTKVYDRDGSSLLPDPQNVLGSPAADGGGYVNLFSDGRWWVPSGRAFFTEDPLDPAIELAFARTHFFRDHRYRDPFGHHSRVRFDAYDLLMLETVDPLGNRITVGERLPNGTLDPSRPGNDYRLLQPRLIMDPNRNRAEVTFDTLGMVVGSAVMGKPEESLGDTLEGFVADLTQAQILNVLSDPLGTAPTWLGHASTRLIYDVFAFQRSRDQEHPEPAAVYTIARETHDADLGAGESSALQHALSFSDGFGREIQQKMPAEPGPVPRRDVAGEIMLGADGRPLMGDQPVAPRWVGTGWTVFDHKGQPVRRFEPFFSDSHRFERDLRIGVSPVLFYDPVGRVVATVHPNHTYGKVTFDPWQQISWDANDTVLDDPRTDSDIAGFTTGYFDALGSDPTLPPWQTWRQRRLSGGLGIREQEAADKASAHGNTPTTAFYDTLGRTFLTRTHNRLSSPGHPSDGAEEITFDRVELDIEGNPRVIRDAIEQDGDALGRVVAAYAYDMLGNRLTSHSMEAGRRWTLDNVVGHSIRGWDDRGFRFRSEIDPLNRPLRSLITGADPSDPNFEQLIERSVYGEQHPDAEQHNLRGALYLILDPAGAVFNEDYDFKGHALSSARRLAADYKGLVDWNAVDAVLPTDPSLPIDSVALEAALAPQLGPDVFSHDTTYDALGRPTTATSPDQSVTRPRYNEAGLLDGLEVQLRGEQANGSPVWTQLVSNIEYDAKGQRRRIDYGNGSSTDYEYDPLTYRLTRLITHRDPAAFPDDCPLTPPAGWPGCQVQNLAYTYDGVGNVTYLRDIAQQTVYFQNQRVEPSADYTYDATYRLIRADGREHLGLNGTPLPHRHNDLPRFGLAHPGDGNALGTYTERYVYDSVGNLLELRHQSNTPSQPSWTRGFHYQEPSLLEPAKTGNRLTRTTIGQDQEIYSQGGDGYDLHGNMLRMPHLSAMHWDHRDQLRWSQRQSLGPQDTQGQERQGERTYYVYDAAGQRVRKVTELAGGALKEERIYLGGFELYRKHAGAEAGLVRETLYVMDDEQRVALVETRTQGSDPAPARQIRYQLSNHLGSACLELDHQSAVISYEEYSPYGSTTYQASQSNVLPKRYRYTGKERDEESGFTYHGARYYAPWLARWTSTDPAGLVDGPNIYRYARNNPITFRDPTGMQSSVEESRILYFELQKKYESGDITTNEIYQLEALGEQLAAADKAMVEEMTPKPFYEHDPGFLRDAVDANLSYAYPLSPGHAAAIKERTGLDAYVKEFGPLDEFAAGAILQDAYEPTTVAGVLGQTVYSFSPHADFQNMGIATYRGDFAGFGWSVAGLVPIGDLAKMFRNLNRLDEVLEVAEVTVELSKKQGDVVKDAVGAGAKWTNKSKGEAGEVAAGWILTGSGHEVLGTIQNNSGNGLDLITRFDGVHYVWEVKANTSQLSAIQQLPDEFISTRALDPLLNPERYDDASIQLAEELQVEISNYNVRYGVIRIDLGSK